MSQNPSAEAQWRGLVGRAHHRETHEEPSDNGRGAARDETQRLSGAAGSRAATRAWTRVEPLSPELAPLLQKLEWAVVGKDRGLKQALGGALRLAVQERVALTRYLWERDELLSINRMDPGRSYEQTRESVEVWELALPSGPVSVTFERSSFEHD